MDVLLICLLAFFSHQIVAQDFQSRCLAFKPQGLYSNASMTVLQYVAKNTTLQLPDNVASCARPSQAVNANLCRIAFSLPTSNRSSITFEAWFPENWTGRFLATGNGGIDGCVKYEDLAYGSANGFASVGTNNGHNGTGGIDFYQNADVVTDYAWRSLHTGVTFGKKLAQAFYESSHTKSYYIGCSLGGQQGIGAADRFPEDFDGIVAGAPAVDFNLLYAWRAKFFTITGSVNSSAFISTTAWKGFIHDEVLRQCDTLDGANDGIIEDPTKCAFEPSSLLCASDDSNSTCLTEEQVKIVRSVFSPMLDDNGTVLYSAMQPGSEAGAADRLYAGVPFGPSEDWYKYVVYDPAWSASSFTSPRDALVADALNPSDIRTWPSSLEVFAQRSGKILTYHGQQDMQISSFNSIRFYEHLKDGMTGTDLDSFYRFFRISGMNHCNGGPGAWVLGQGGNTAAAGIPFETRGNVLAAMVAWVERDVAPVSITGTKFVNDTVASGVSFQRRHCKYPATNTFLGGNPQDIEAWECRT